MNTITNHDAETGIAFGIIPQRDVMPDCLDDCEYDYGQPEEGECEECGCLFHLEHDPKWYDLVTCPDCGEEFELKLHNDAEANSFTIERDGYALSGECGSYTSSSDLWILKSPYYTIAEKCSPCAPGAGYLKPLDYDGDEAAIMVSMRNSMGRGEKTYCLDGHFFESGIAPYPMWYVETGERVIEVKEAHED